MTVYYHELFCVKVGFCERVMSLSLPISQKRTESQRTLKDVDVQSDTPTVTGGMAVFATPASRKIAQNWSTEAPEGAEVAVDLVGIVVCNGTAGCTVRGWPHSKHSKP